LRWVLTRLRLHEAGLLNDPRITHLSRYSIDPRAFFWPINPTGFGNWVYEIRLVNDDSQTPMLWQLCRHSPAVGRSDLVGLETSRDRCSERQARVNAARSRIAMAS